MMNERIKYLIIGAWIPCGGQPLVGRLKTQLQLQPVVTGETVAEGEAV